MSVGAERGAGAAHRPMMSVRAALAETRLPMIVRVNFCVIHAWSIAASAPSNPAGSSVKPPPGGAAAAGGGASGSTGSPAPAAALGGGPVGSASEDGVSAASIVLALASARGQGGSAVRETVVAPLCQTLSGASGVSRVTVRYPRALHHGGVLVSPSRPPRAPSCLLRSARLPTPALETWNLSPSAAKRD